MTFFNTRLLTIALLASGCQIPTTQPRLEAETYWYQDTAYLQNFIVVRVFRDGGATIQNVDLYVEGKAEIPGRGTGEFIIEADAPVMKFYLPAGFDAGAQTAWTHDGCAYSVLQRGHFYLSGKGSPTVNVAVNCSGEPTMRFVYATQFGLLGFTGRVGDKINTYWLIGEAPLGFGPQPANSAQK